MLVRIFMGGIATVIEAPAGSKVLFSQEPDLPDVLQVPGGRGRSDVFLPERVAIEAARGDRYGLRLAQSQVSRGSPGR
jgi:hypothetical protein